MRYKLTATRHGWADKAEVFEAENDLEATAHAIMLVMGKAMASSTWSKGRIVLSQGDRIVHIMEEKQ